MKATPKSDQPGGAQFWPQLITAIVLRLRPLARDTAPKRLPFYTPVERFMTDAPCHFHHRSMYDR